MRIRLWDLPTRLFHWLLVLAVAGAFITAKIGGNAMHWHGRLGLFIFGLLVFRFVWGFVGSTHARFFNFVRGPAAIRDYLAGRWQGVGHNPLGAFSVLALLGVLTAQAVSGLFSHDDIAFAGPLARLLASDCVSDISSVHRLLEKVLIVLVALHLAAIVFYARVKRQNLVKPMITGWSEGDESQSAQGGGFLALLFAVILALLAVSFASGAWLPEPPPAAPTATPDW